MNEDKTAEMVKHEVAEALGVSPARITGETLLRKDLGAESIDLIDLTFRFEKGLGKALSEQEIFQSSRADGDVSITEVIGTLISKQKSGL